MKVEVVYGTAEKQTLIEIMLHEGATVAEAIQQSQIATLWPEINFEQQRVGIFGKFVTMDAIVKPYDRIEIYRPLIIDPKEARKLRIKKKR